MDDVSREIERRSKIQQIHRLRKQKKRLRKNESPESINRQIKSILPDIVPPLFPLRYYQQSNTKKTVSPLLLPCPVSSCRGYIMEKTYSCALCKTELCNKCLHILHENHSCVQQDVDSALKILQETKPCPRCAIRIYKISGCDQMWCVQCHSSFSSETGQILVNGAIHNPNYFYWLYNNNNNLDHENPENCQRFENIVMHHLRQKCTCTRIKTCIHADMFRDALNIMRKFLHVEHVILLRYDINYLNTNRDLRLKYLLHEIDREDVERILVKREKRNLKKTALYHALVIFVETGKEILYRYVIEKSWDNTELFVKEIENITELTRETIEQIVTVYGGSFNEISLFHNIFD